MARTAQSYLRYSPVVRTKVGSGVASRPEGSKMLAAVLLSAVLAALLVVADQLVDTWADGHLLAAWVAMWSVAFGALALLAPPLRQLSSYVASQVAVWNQGRAQRRAEAGLWACAQSDYRVMGELVHASQRD